MNNAEFKLQCLKNGLFSPDQVIEFYNVIYKENKKFSKRDAQLWLNGKKNDQYIIDQTAIAMIESLNQIRKELITEETKRIAKGEPRYTSMFKSSDLMYSVYRELEELPVNFYNSILIELGIENVDYYKRTNTI